MTATHAAADQAASLFDVFGVNADLGPKRANDNPAPLTYGPRAWMPRPLTNNTYEPYTVQRIAIKGARSHANLLVESAAMASVAPPLPSYRPRLRPSIVSRGLLSAEQLEPVIYAGEQHSRTFTVTTMGEHGPVVRRYRNGFVIGDGTGVGKGRCVAAIIADNVAHGRTRAVWFSANANLIDDAVRDWTDIGEDPKAIVAWQKTSFTDTLTVPEHTILFGTYALARHQKRIGVDPDTNAILYQRRLDQLVAALGPDFDGVIVFDEAGELENGDPHFKDSEGYTSRKASLQGRVAIELQERLPDARVLYVSATAAQRIDALAYSPRLQLWGDGTAFPTKRHFLTTMVDGGTAALEVICRDLKAQGKLCARSLSYEGVQYERLTHELDDVQIDQWNAYTSAWRMIEHSFLDEFLAQNLLKKDEGAFEYMAPRGNALRGIRSGLESAKQRFFSQALMSLEWPTVQAYIGEELARDRAVCIQLTHTNQAQLERALDDMDESQTLDDIVVSHKGAIKDFIEKSYPVNKYYVTVKDEKRCIEVSHDADGAPIVLPDALLRRDELIEKIDEMLFPETILELLYEAFPENVAEISGRTKRLAWEEAPDGTRSRALLKRTPATANARALAAFRNDEKQILVFTENCGGIGQSFHADIRYPNHRPRTHIILEMSWSASRALQSCGRTHRTGQVCPPLYTFVSTTVPGQKRFSSTPARRVAALGALTRGQREAADNGLFRAEDNLETPYAAEALKRLLVLVRDGKIRDVSARDFFLQTRIDVTRIGKTKSTSLTWPPPKTSRVIAGVTMPIFLNRLLACDIAADGGIQQRIMDAFMTLLGEVINEARANNALDAGVETISPEELVVRERHAVTTDPHGATLTEYLVLDAKEPHPDLVSWKTALDRRNAYAAFRGARDPRFVVNARTGAVALHIPVVHTSAVATPQMRVITPLGTETLPMKRLGVRMSSLKSIDEATAQPLWEAAYASAPHHTYELHAISGQLLPVWDKLGNTYPRIYRMQTNTGERLLARILASGERTTVLAALGLVAVADVA